MEKSELKSIENELKGSLGIWLKMSVEKGENLSREHITSYLAGYGASAMFNTEITEDEMIGVNNAVIEEMFAGLKIKI